MSAKTHIYLQALKELVLKGRNSGGKLYIALVKPLLDDAVRLESPNQSFMLKSDSSQNTHLIAATHNACSVCMSAMIF